MSNICHNLEDALVPLRSHVNKVNIAWAPPSLGIIKIKVDGSYLLESNRSEIKGEGNVSESY